jgi:small-conductance mechanosensitive channel
MDTQNLRDSYKRQRRSSSLSLPRTPGCSLCTRLFTNALLKMSKSSLAITIIFFALHLTDSVDTTYQPLIRATLTGAILNLLWKSILRALQEFQRELSMPSELEEKLLLLVVSNIDHLSSWTTRMEDLFLVIFLSCLSLDLGWLYLPSLILFKLIFGLRLVSFVSQLLEIISQTAWLESTLCTKNQISKSQTELFMHAFDGPFKIACYLLVLNDIASTAGLNTMPLFYSLIVGAGVLGASAQSVVIDFVASLHLMFARPFQAGDAISVGDVAQVMTVREISYKYTRLRAMDGQDIIYPNHLIANSALQNFGSLIHRRRIFSHWKISRTTPTEVLKRLPALMKECVEAVNVSDLGPMNSTENGEGSDKKIPCVEHFCAWVERIELHYVLLEVGFILIDIPDFRKAQHRMNIEIMSTFEQHNIQIASFSKPSPSQLSAAFAATAEVIH